MPHPIVRVVPITIVLAAAVLAQDGPSVDTLRATVRGAVEWIARQAEPVPGVDGAVLVRANAKPDAPQSPIVYGGAAGVLLFLENVAAVLDDATARSLADRIAKGLRSCRRQEGDAPPSWNLATGNAGAGLYTGDAGIGHAFLVRHQLRGDAEALATAVEIGDALLARATRSERGLGWGNQPDLIIGNAGTALFLLDLAEASGQARFADGARQAGRELVAMAVMTPSKTQPDKQLPHWMYMAGRRAREMPNFSHGTAGVAYALLRIGAATDDAELIASGRAGAETMLEFAVVEGDTCKWPAVPGQKAFLGGWCHGPAGTARLFLLLHAMTKEERFLAVAKQGASFLVGYAKDAEKAGPDGKRPYVPPSYCCGVAGVLEFFCDLHRVTGEAGHAAFARQAGQYLLDVAIPDGDGRKWKNGASAPGPGKASSEGHDTDLMLGAAGEALALLQLSLLDQKELPLRRLPDRTLVPGAAAIATKPAK
jgi:lantibiotic modifying enzyme